MPNMNHFMCKGHLARDASLKTSDDGSQQWCEFTVAVKSGGKANPTTLWVSGRIYGNTAAKAAELFKKGDAIYCSGPLNAKAYARKQDNVPQPGLSILVNDWQWLCPSKKSELLTDIPQYASTVPTNTDDVELPF